MKKYLSRILFISIFLTLLVGLYKGNQILKLEKRWFYSTGTSEVVFDNITWGMSRIEVERSIGQKLNTRIDFKIEKNDKYLYAVGKTIAEEAYYNSQKQLHPIHYLIDPKYDNTPIPQKIKNKISVYTSSPLNNFFETETLDLILVFYEDQLFSVKIIPIIEYNQIDYLNFSNEVKELESKLINNLKNKFGSILLSYEYSDYYPHLKNLKFHLTQNSNTLIDGYLLKKKVNYFNDGDLSFLYRKAICTGAITLRYKPLIFQIENDLANSNGDFFN